MKDSDRKFLEDLIEAVSPSGFEEEAVELWKAQVADAADKVEVDVHGNCIAALNAEGSPRVMLAGHIDEIGFMVKYIDENGYIYFSSVGGVDPQVVPGQRVKIKTDDGYINGVIGRKPIHLLEDEEKKKAPKIEDLWIDTGCEDAEAAKQRISIGDAVVFDVGLTPLDSKLVTGRGFDDRVGAFVAARVLNELAGKKLAAALYSVATVQEEIGLRGAKTSAYGIAPDVGIAVDVTFASDFPTMDKKKSGDVKVGGGPVIARGPNITPRIFKGLVEIAESAELSYQIQSISRATGTDANVIQTTRAGVATGLLSIPLRYMHTPVEVVSTEDLENTVLLLQKFIGRIDEFI